MTERPLISLCIPTNGVEEWVFPVLNSIYAQGVDEKLFEVVVMDNGNNTKFQEKMGKYVLKHRNLMYETTDAQEFLSEIETYKVANGIFIKFINHRTKLLDGTLQYFIDFVVKNKDKKPIIYFSNGALSKKKVITEYHSFNDFIRRLSYWSSWSTGMAFWKSDFDSMRGLDQCNILFPHTNILFAIRTGRNFIVDNKTILDEIPAGKIPKGRYNLFQAFAIEYPAIITDLYREGDISLETLLKVKKDNLKFVSILYLDYILLRKKCSYDLALYKQSISIFYSNHLVFKNALQILIKRVIKKCVYPLQQLKR